MPGLFCPTCGASLECRYVETEGRDRLVCESGHIHYQNPHVVAGTLPIHDGKVWLLRRAIEPRYGYWTFPGGFMELGESVEQAALRETLEEIRIQVRLTGLLNVYSRAEATNVFVVFMAEADGTATAGDEALEVRAFSPMEIPWTELAFWSTGQALEEWSSDLRPGAKPAGSRKADQSPRS